MSDKPRKRPRCSLCGQCCRAPVILITKPGDYRRWRLQGRWDILSRASIPPRWGYGDIRVDTGDGAEPGYCPFIRKVSHHQYICTIHDTKPKVCQDFRCEWAYGVGEKGVPFKMERGWSDKARQLGYGQTSQRRHSHAAGG